MRVVVAASFVLAASWLVAGAVASAQECAPACRAGYVCQAGQCVSACNPPCEAGTVCAESAGQFACISNAPTNAGYPPPMTAPPQQQMRMVHVQDQGLITAGWLTFSISWAVSVPFWYVSGLFSFSSTATALQIGLSILPVVNGASLIFIPTATQLLGLVLLIIGYVGHDQLDVVPQARIGDVTMALAPIVAPNTGGLALAGSF